MQTKTQKPQGFTLVELLVVITIIGILATGAISMFTGAQQKARDSVRVTDVQALKLATEQYYGDNGEYPNQNGGTSPEGVDALAGVMTGGYINKLPKDPKSLSSSANTCFVYIYGSSYDEMTRVQGQEFEYSAAFENKGNIDSKALRSVDQGEDDFRWETGVNIDHVNTKILSTGMGAASASASGSPTVSLTVGNQHVFGGLQPHPYRIDDNRRANTSACN